jgi:hypothetical protein
MAAATKPDFVVPPGDGEYITDGTRLAQVCGLDAKGDFILEDCKTDEQFTVTPDDLTEEWVTAAEFERKKKRKA